MAEGQGNVGRRVQREGTLPTTRHVENSPAVEPAQINPQRTVNPRSAGIGLRLVAAKDAVAISEAVDVRVEMRIEDGDWLRRRRDCYREGFVEGEPASVGHPRHDSVARGRPEVEQCAVGDLQLRADELEPPARVVDQAERVNVARVRVGHAVQHANGRIVGHALHYRARRQREPSRRLVDVGHGDREGLVEGQPRGVSHPHRDGVARRGLEVEQRAIRDL